MNRAVSVWAVSVTALCLLEAVVRLGHRAMQTVAHGLDLHGWCALVLLTGVMMYAEGYRALHLRFVPEVVSRSIEAGRTARGVGIVLAPLYALSLVGGSLGSRVRAWIAVVGIVIAMHIVRALPAPWRGIVDGAVAAALAFGLCSLVVRFVTEMGGFLAPEEKRT